MSCIVISSYQMKWRGFARIRSQAVFASQYYCLRKKSISFCCSQLASMWSKSSVCGFPFLAHMLSLSENRGSTCIVLLIKRILSISACVIYYYYYFVSTVITATTITVTITVIIVIVIVVIVIICCCWRPLLLYCRHCYYLFQFLFKLCGFLAQIYSVIKIVSVKLA